MENYQELANKYFAEYQTKPINELNADLQRWESVATTIRSMQLSERAKYADYATKKMCENHSEIALQYTHDAVIPMFGIIDLNTLNTCAIANIAAHLMLLPENERVKYDIPIAGGMTCIVC